MLVTLAEAKLYLRVDGTYEDSKIEDSLKKAHSFVQAVSRLDDTEFAGAADSVKEAVLYTTAYLYTHTEDADHNELGKTIRALLCDVRKDVF